MLEPVDGSKENLGSRHPNTLIFNEVEVLEVGRSFPGAKPAEVGGWCFWVAQA